MNKRIKFVYFDVGGVFFDWRSSRAALAELLGVDLNSSLPVFSKWDTKCILGEVNDAEMYESIKAELGIHSPDLKSEDFREFWIKNFLPFNEMINFSLKIDEKYKVGLITNIFPDHLELLVQKGLVPNLNYDVVIESCVLGVAKPDKRIYEVAQELSGQKPNEILFIDDSIENFEVPNLLGWETFHFDYENHMKSINELNELLLN